MWGEKMATKTKPQGYWKDLDNILAEARKIMGEHGFEKLPGQQRLSTLGYSSLANAIIKHHGGFRRVRILLGQQEQRVKDGQWKNIEYTLDQAREAMEKAGRS